MIYRLFINENEVADFRQEIDAYRYALAIEANETFESYNPRSDKVTFETEYGTMGTEQYSEYLQDQFTTDLN